MPVRVVRDGKIDRARDAHDDAPSTWWGPLSKAEADVGAPIDANGNLTSDGTRTFEWDARNQLVAVTVGTHRSEFAYDGKQRRVRQIEKDNGITTADTWVLWCETAICEERAVDGVTVSRRAFGLGEQINGQGRFFATDHLGSVTDVMDTSATLLGRYTYDPWGRRTVVSGSEVTSVGFTGHRTHTASALALAMYRGYDVALGRWLSEDPIGLEAGINRYRYVLNKPNLFVDQLGLKVTNKSKSTIHVKEENSGKTHAVPPGGTWSQAQDGVALPYVRPCQVFKTVDDVDVTVEPDGTVTTQAAGFVARIGQAVRGGWGDGTWVKEQQRKGDTGWDELYERSCTCR